MTPQGGQMEVTGSHTPEVRREFWAGGFLADRVSYSKSAFFPPDMARLSPPGNDRGTAPSRKGAVPRSNRAAKPDRSFLDPELLRVHVLAVEEHEILELGRERLLGDVHAEEPEVELVGELGGDLPE